MAESKPVESIPADEEANAALTRGSKRESSEETARNGMGGFRRSQSAEPLDVVLEEAGEQARERRAGE